MRIHVSIISTGVTAGGRQIYDNSDQCNWVYFDNCWFNCCLKFCYGNHSHGFVLWLDMTVALMMILHNVINVLIMCLHHLGNDKHLQNKCKPKEKQYI